MPAGSSWSQDRGRRQWRLNIDERRRPTSPRGAGIAQVYVPTPDRGRQAEPSLPDGEIAMTVESTGALVRQTVMPNLRTVEDELDGIVTTICAKYPDHKRSEITALVSATYERLKAGANVSAHLIPLTLNLSLRALHRARIDVGPT